MIRRGLALTRCVSCPYRRTGTSVCIAVLLVLSARWLLQLRPLLLPSPGVVFVAAHRWPTRHPPAARPPTDRRAHNDPPAAPPTLPHPGQHVPRAAGGWAPAQRGVPSPRARLRRGVRRGRADVVRRHLPGRGPRLRRGV